MRSALLVAVFALLAVPAHAQTNDSRWEPWLGCWTLAADNLRPREAPEDAAGRAARRPATVIDGAPRVCVSPTPAGARFETTVGPQTAIDQTIVADAAAHPVNDGECSGTQRSQWSTSGLRLYSAAEIRCTGDSGPRRVSGMSLIAPNGDWLDIQAVVIGERETVRVKRYYRAAGSAGPSRPNVAASRLTLDEVKEASSRVSSAALEAALIETLAGFDLNGKKVMDLASAGVPERVIDLLVALSYPDKFVVQRVAQMSPSGQTTFVRDPFLIGGYAPYFYDDYYYGSPYFYEPFGYRGYSFFNYGPAFVVSRPADDRGGGSNGSATGSGRVVNGQGYTRVIPRPEAGSTVSDMPARAASRSSGSSSAPADTSSSSGSSSSGSSSSSSSGSSGGGSASSGGSSSGSSDSGGRTAVPR